jgi:hypothetical protein
MKKDKINGALETVNAHRLVSGKPRGWPEGRGKDRPMFKWILYKQVIRF